MGTVDGIISECENGTLVFYGMEEVQSVFKGGGGVVWWSTEVKGKGAVLVVEKVSASGELQGRAVRLKIHTADFI